MSVGCGWGYEIVIEDTVYIHQPHVPAIIGERPFADRRQAAAVGEMVKQRIEHGQKPTIFTSDLRALKILSVSC